MTQLPRNFKEHLFWQIVATQWDQLRDAVVLIWTFKLYWGMFSIVFDGDREKVENIFYFLICFAKRNLYLG